MIDILMVTYDRPVYTRLALTRLLETCGRSGRVWLWHNGCHQETLEIVHAHADDPHVAAFHHSEENQRLRAPTNWLWDNADGDYLSKVDDDCLVAPGWSERLVSAHEANPEFGIVGSWRFLEEDFVPWLAKHKIRSYRGGHRLMRHPWVQGSGYVMKRRCVEELGPLAAGQNFSEYCTELAFRGWVNGWYYPFLPEDHMDDPRSPNTMLTSDEALRRNLPLSAQDRGVITLEEWETQMKLSALMLQASPTHPRNYVGARGRAHRTVRRLIKALM